MAQPRAAALYSSVFATVIAVAVYAHALQKPLDHDEHQFVASAALIAREGLVPYRDFPYYHLPYLSYVYAAAFLVTDHLLAAARVVAASAALAVALVVWRRARRMLAERDGVVATAGASVFVLALVTNPLFLDAAGRAWNHDVAILTALAAALVLGAAPSTRRAVPLATAAGALLGVAIATRSTMSLLAPPLFAAAAFTGGRSAATSRSRLLAALAGGVVLALAPLVVFYLLAPAKFVYGNLTYNLVLNPQYRHEMGYDVAMSDAQKLGYLLDTVLAHPRNAALVLAYLASAVAGLATIRRSTTPPDERASATAITLGLCLPFLLVAAFLPTPTWFQYYYALVPFLLVGTIANLSVCDSSGLTWMARAAALPMLLGAITGARYYAPYFFRAPTAEWTAFAVHRTGERIAAAAGADRVLTLGPIFVLEGGARIYPELATGAFEWRTTPLLELGERERLGLLGPDELAALDSRSELAAVLTGVERDPEENLEASLLTHVSGGAWTPTTIGDDLTLWRRPRK